jgi:TRAP-type transport system periplasmic protein
MPENIRLCAVAAALAMMAGTASAETWTAQIWGPKRASSVPFEWYAQQVEAKTGGAMKMKFEYDKGKPTTSTEVMASGTVQGVYYCAQYYPDKMPLSTVLELPMFAPETVTQIGKVGLALADHPVIQDELRRYNTKMLLPAPLPHYQLMGTRKVVRIDDFKGSKVRIAGEMGKILQEYGATINVVASTESAAALRSGTLDLVALPYPYAFASFGIDSASKHVTERISLGAPLCYLGVSQKAWDALPASTQKVMLSLRAPTMDRFEDAYAEGDAKNIASFRSQGLEFSNFNPADRARLVARSIKVWQQWVEEREKQGLKAREVFEFAQAKVREVSRSK